MTAVLIACAHGTRFEEGRVVVRELLEVLRATAPAGVEVLEAYVDVHGPYVTDVVAAARERTDDIVIVPLLLSTGYHTEVDLVEAADGLPVAPALGPHPVLAEILADRVRAAGAAPDDTVVLAAAGSTRPGAVVDVERMAELMADAGVTGPVVTAYAAASDPPHSGCRGHSTRGRSTHGRRELRARTGTLLARDREGGCRPDHRPDRCRPAPGDGGVGAVARCTCAAPVADGRAQW